MEISRHESQALLAGGRDIDFFGIVTEVLQGDTLAPYLFLIFHDFERRLI